MKAMYKFELAAYAGVSSKTLRRWMNRYQSELDELGVTRKSRLLPPSAVKFLCEKFSIDA